MKRLLLRPEDAAEIIGVSRSKLYKMVALGVVPSVRLGGRALRVPAEALEKWVRSQMAHETSRRRGASSRARSLTLVGGHADSTKRGTVSASEIL